VQISDRQWTDIIKILDEFDISEEIDNQEHLWEIIINIRENMYNEIKKGIRINLQLCFFLEEKKQIRDINRPFFHLNHIFEQDFYRIDLDSYLGLSNFHKLIYFSYGNLERFILELQAAKENLFFIRKGYHKILVEYYSYLKSISLPPKNYNELRSDLKLIFNKYSMLTGMITETSLFDSLIKNIDSFKKRYCIIYKEEHDNFQNQLAEFYEKLHFLPEYRALINLSCIEAINFDKPIKRYIDNFFPARCRINNLDEILKKEAKCRCGFTLGDLITIPSLQKIKPLLRKGVKEYVKELQSERYRPIFSSYLSYNRDSRIKKLLETSPERLDELLNIIDDEIVKEINLVFKMEKIVMINLVK
jgi:hypothetical protein